MYFTKLWKFHGSKYYSIVEVKKKDYVKGNGSTIKSLTKKIMMTSIVTLSSNKIQNIWYIFFFYEFIFLNFAE